VKIVGRDHQAMALLRGPAPEDILDTWGDDVDQTTDPTTNSRNPVFDGRRGIAGDLAYREYMDPADRNAVIALAHEMRDAIKGVRGRVYKDGGNVGRLRLQPPHRRVEPAEGPRWRMVSWTSDDGMTASPRKPSAAKRASFVFTGTVQALKRSTVPNIPPSSRTAVVRVDDVVRASGALSRLAGHDITVQLGDRERMRPGQTATFYTESWLFGEGVAVRSLGHADVRRAAAVTAASAREPVRAKAAKDLDQHVADADLIVRGRVARVASRATTPGHARGAGSTPKAAAPISEHAALWREAVIDVDQVTKGTRLANRVTVRFPSSTDVRWAKVPKLRPGQEGVFLLHRADTDSGYTLLHEQDVQPPDPAHVAPRAASRRHRRRS
jgi:hypothetical protein